MHRKARVCVVDDNVEAAKVLAKELHAHGYETLEAYTGQDALTVCADGALDLVLLDVSMPDLSGFEVCEALRKNEATKDIPVIFVTARGEPAAIERGIELGAKDYITKPYNLPMVLVRVEAVLAEYSLSSPHHLDHAGILDSVYTDNITGLRNRRYLMERLQEEADKSFRYDFPVSIAVFDIDDIEKIGESENDISLEDILAEVAMVMRAQSRTYDVLARYDDTIFVALLPHAPVEQGIGYCEKIMEEFDFTTLSEPKVPSRATLSSGVVTIRNSRARAADAIFAEAMQTLLWAKSDPEKRVIGRALQPDE